MGTSHMIYTPNPENKNEGLMVDVEVYSDCTLFEIGLGRWSTGAPSLGFNATISNLTFDQFSTLVDNLVELRDKHKQVT